MSCADVARGRLAGGRAAPRPLSSPLRSGNRTISGSYGSNSEIIHDSTSDFVVLPCVLHTGVPFPVSITTHYQASTTPTCYSCTTPYGLWRLGRATSHLSNGSEMEPSLRAGGTAPLSEAKVGTDPTRAW